MLRKAVLALGLSLSLWPINGTFAADAQQAERVYRIGFLRVGNLTIPKAFWDSMREFGWIEGKNVRIEPRYGRFAANSGRSALQRPRQKLETSRTSSSEIHIIRGQILILCGDRLDNGDLRGAVGIKRRKAKPLSTSRSLNSASLRSRAVPNMAIIWVSIK